MRAVIDFLLKYFFLESTKKLKLIKEKKNNVTKKYSFIITRLTLNTKKTWEKSKSFNSFISIE